MLQDTMHSKISYFSDEQWIWTLNWWQPYLERIQSWENQSRNIKNELKINEIIIFRNSKILLHMTFLTTLFRKSQDYSQTYFFIVYQHCDYNSSKSKLYLSWGCTGKSM
jgi:hypothetical protein